MRAPRKFPNGEEWIGKRVLFKMYGSPIVEYGNVIRMSDSKNLAVWVKLDHRESLAFCYVKDLKIII